MKMKITAFGIAVMTLCASLAVMPASASDFTLDIFGNANMDDIIDELDIEYVQGIIDGVNEPTQFADANYDGVMDDKDIEQIRQIIEGEETDLTILDLADRTVTIKIPVERVVLTGSRNIQEFAAVEGGMDFSKKIVGWGPDLKNYDKDSYEKYSKKFPEIEEIPDVGYHYTGTFNVEKVISLRPNVVLMPIWIRGTADDDINKLEQAGIPSVYLDFWIEANSDNLIENSYIKYKKSTLLLGMLLGRDERAREIVNFHQDQVDKVATRLKTINSPKPKVYQECGNLGPSTYASTSGKGYFWGAVISMCRGINIAEEAVEAGKSGVISPEYLLKQNPDVIIITGSNWPAATDSMRLGYYAEQTESRELLTTFTERPGWNTLNAVKNQRIYSIYHTLPDKIYNFAVIEAAAKCLYPEEFKDFDPEESIKEFHEKFLPVDYSGVWMISLEE